MPPGAFAVVRLDQLFGNLLGDEDLAPGVIFCLRSDNAKVRIDSTYALAPHYLVYARTTARPGSTSPTPARSWTCSRS